jgi:hypothetical protein
MRLLQAGVRIIGLGYGTFAILLGFLVALLVFVLARFTAHAEVITLAGLLVPAILILVFVLPPRESQRPPVQPSSVTDPSFVPYLIFLVLGILGLLLALIFQLQAFVFNYKFGKNVAQLGFTSAHKEREHSVAERAEVEDEERKLLP